MQQVIFPKEVTSNVPRIVLTGRERLLVEQHMGLDTCTSSEIAFSTKNGRLTVTGRDLLFLRYTQTEALITGYIDTVCFNEKGRRG